MLVKFIKEDLRQGIWARKLIYIFVLIAVAVVTAVYIKFFISKGFECISFGDMIVYHFRGMQEYVKNNFDKKGFDIPEDMIVWVMLTAFLVGHYPVKDLKGIGKNYLIQSGKRKWWWISKCIFGICSVLTLMLVVMLGTFLGVVITEGIGREGAFSLAVNPKLMKRVFGAGNIAANTSLAKKTMILVTLSLITFALIQLMLIVIGDAIAGYMGVIAVAVLSSYYMRFFLPGNAVMVYRYVEINDRGIGLVETIISLAITMFVSVIVGYISFRRKDII